MSREEQLVPETRKIVIITCDVCGAELCNGCCISCGCDICYSCTVFLECDPFNGTDQDYCPDTVCGKCNDALQPFREQARLVNEFADRHLETIMENWRAACQRGKA